MADLDRSAAHQREWPEGGLPHGEHPYDYGYGEDQKTGGGESLPVSQPPASGESLRQTAAPSPAPDAAKGQS